MNREELRLRCVEAATSKVSDYAEIMSRAKKFYDFVVEPGEDTNQKPQVEAKKLDLNKRIDNARILP